LIFGDSLLFSLVVVSFRLDELVGETSEEDKADHPHVQIEMLNLVFFFRGVF